jgi:hypothetical protein
MVKAKLASVTEQWIDGKTKKHNDVKTENQQDDEAKIMQTVYIARRASKLLWHHRAETGEKISHTIERLVLEHVGK